LIRPRPNPLAILDHVDDYAARLLAKLAPESINRALIRAGCFLSACELIKAEVVDGVHEFFASDFRDGKFICDEARYQRDVLSRNQSKYRASCAWLVEMGALTTAQVEVLEDIYAHRKEIAHELPKLLVDPNFEVKADLLLAAVDCLRSLGVFWGQFVVWADPQWVTQTPPQEDIKSGSYLLMEYLVSLAGLDQGTELEGENSS
jgi:hypothetical protein